MRMAYHPECNGLDGMRGIVQIRLLPTSALSESRNHSMPFRILGVWVFNPCMHGLTLPCASLPTLFNHTFDDVRSLLQSLSRFRAGCSSLFQGFPVPFNRRLTDDHNERKRGDKKIPQL